MPFKKSDSKKTLTNASKIFIGRTDEIHFFEENILRPEDPTYNIVSISGQGGTGKTTLLTKFISKACATDFIDYCLVVKVDERQVTPAGVMEKFAEQLRKLKHPLANFETALIYYKDALRKIKIERDTVRDAFLRKTAPEVAGSIAKSVPVVGGVLEGMTKAATEFVLDEYHARQQLKDAERLEDPIGDLTRAFVRDLNQLVEVQVSLRSTGKKRQLRVILCFDTFEQLAIEITPWLLDYFLEFDINSNIVLVIAGRDSLERSIPGSFIRWLPYMDNNSIYSITLNSFTEDETRSYLRERGITDPQELDKVWQASHGLPLYLSLLATNAKGAIDPAKGVVDNFLRGIPETEEVRLRLVLDAALFSKPFNQDDLAAFTYLPQQHRLDFYKWLVDQPLCRVFEDGKYSYHDLTKELCSRHLYQQSKEIYYSTRHSLVAYYQQQLERTQREKGKEMYDSVEWLDQVLALTSQLLFLPDEVSHIGAIEWILDIYEHAKQKEAIARVLREVSREHPTNLADSTAKYVAKQLLQYIESNLASQRQELIAASSFLLEKIACATSFSSELWASVYRRRGRAYRDLKKYELALADFCSAINLHPSYERAHAGRGQTYRLLKKYEQAIKDFDRALELDPQYAWVYHQRAKAYAGLKKYEQAAADLIRRQETLIEEATERIKKMSQNQIVSGDGEALAKTYRQRGRAYRDLKKYELALADFEQALNLNPDTTHVYASRGEIYHRLQKYEQAMKDFDRALELNPQYAWAYARRGQIFSLRGEYLKAMEDFARALELNARLVEAFAGQGQVHYLLKEYQKALESFDQALEINPSYLEGLVGRGQTYYVLHEYHKALEDFNHALVLDPENAIAQDGREAVLKDLQIDSA